MLFKKNQLIGLSIIGVAGFILLNRGSLQDVIFTGGSSGGGAFPMPKQGFSESQPIQNFFFDAPSLPTYETSSLLVNEPTPAKKKVTYTESPYQTKLADPFTRYISRQPTSPALDITKSAIEQGSFFQLSGMDQTIEKATSKKDSSPALDVTRSSIQASPFFQLSGASQSINKATSKKEVEE